MDSGVILSDHEFSVSIHRKDVKHYSATRSRKLDDLSASNDDDDDLNRSLDLGGSYYIVPRTDTNKRRDHSTS